MEKAEWIIKLAASSIAVIVPCVLLAGYSYHLGYILTFGLSSDLVPKSMSEMLVESWYVSVMAMGWVLSKWPYILVGSIAFFLLFVGVFFFLRRAKRNGVTWIFEEITKENQGKIILGVTQWHWVCLGELFSYIFNWVSTPLFIIALLSLLTAFPFLDAKGFASEQMGVFEKEGCENTTEKLSCIKLVDTKKQQNNVLAEGILVSANGQRIAIYNKQLEVWPLLDNYILTKKGIIEQVKQETDQQQ